MLILRIDHLLLRASRVLTRRNCERGLTSRLSAFPPRQRHLRRVIAAHPVHSPTWWSGRGANVNIARRRGVMSPSWAKQKLTHIQRPPPDIPSYEVSVHALKALGRKDTSR